MSESENGSDVKKLLTPCDVGNYARGVRDRTSLEEQAISFVMLGNPYRGASLLRGITNRSSRAQFFLAAALWMAGSDADANDALTYVSGNGDEWGDAASKLKHLISNDRSVILMVPTFSDEWVGDTLCGNDTKIEIVKLGSEREPIGSDGQPFDITKYDPVSTIALNLGLHTVNPSFAKTWKIPSIGWTQDVDITLGQAAAFSKEFDAIICFTGGEHEILERMVNCSLYTYIGFEPYFIGYASSFDEAQLLKSAAISKDRPIDISFAGDPFHWAYYDKHARLSKILSAGSDLRVSIWRQSLGHAGYFDLLRKTTFTPTSTRFNDSISNRTFDALLNGAMPLYYDESIVPFVLGEYAEFSCGLNSDASSSDINYIVRNGKSVHRKLAQNYDDLSRSIAEWRPTKRDQSSRFLRYCFIISILPSKRNSKHRHHELHMAVDRHREANFCGSLISYVDAVAVSEGIQIGSVGHFAGILSVWARNYASDNDNIETENLIDNLVVKNPKLRLSLLNLIFAVYRRIDSGDSSAVLAAVSEVASRAITEPDDLVSSLTMLPDVPRITAGYSIARIRQELLASSCRDKAKLYLDGLLSLICASKLADTDPMVASSFIEAALQKLPPVSTLYALAAKIYRLQLVLAPDIVTIQRHFAILQVLRSENIGFFCDEVKKAPFGCQSIDMVTAAIDAVMGVEDWYFDHAWALFLGSHIDVVLDSLFRRGLIMSARLEDVARSSALLEHTAARRLTMIAIIGRTEILGSRKEDLTVISDVGRKLAVDNNELYPFLYSEGRYRNAVGIAG